MLDSVRVPFDQCLRIIQDNIQLDPHFVDFYHWANEHNVPIVILSSGMTPIINELLVSRLGGKLENIFVVANYVEPRSGKQINEDGGWRIKYRDNR
jgi:2-hydroxy-3-keto-5-methylthiopentenyl-1-phosphate phosphatase